MHNLPAIPFDYRIFIFALPFFMLAGQSAKLHRRSNASVPWSFLIWFGLGYGLAEWLILLAPEPSGPTTLRLLRVAIMTSALFALLEFGRRQVRIVGRSLQGSWIYPPLIVLALAGALQGLEGLAATCRYALGIPGSVMSGFALWRLSGSHTGQQRLGLRAAAVSLWLAVPAIVLAAPNTLLAPAIGGQHGEFLAFARNLSQAVFALCALGAWTGLGIYRSKPSSAAGHESQFPLGYVASAIVLSVTIGFAAMDLYDAGAQGNPTDVVLAVLAPQDDSQPASHANRTWEQIMCDRRQMGLNFLKGAAVVVVCLIGICYCLNVGWSALKPKKQVDSSNGLRGAG